MRYSKAIEEFCSKRKSFTTAEIAEHLLKKFPEIADYKRALRIARN